MENTKKKNTIFFYLHEFLGTAFLCLAYNLGGKIASGDSTKGGVSPMLFVVSMWSWDLSCAHFNLAVSLGSLVFNLS